MRAARRPREQRCEALCDRVVGRGDVQMALLIDYAKALFDIATIIAVQSVMLCQVAFGYYRLKGDVPDGVTASREDLPKDATLSIVIPAYREAATIEATLRRVAQAASWPSRCEVIVVDAGGGDDTMPIVQRVKKELSDFDITTTTSTGGRGPAVAAGAAKAKGQALLVLHADTLLPYAFDDRIIEALGANYACCFRFAVDRTQIHWKGLLRWLRLLPFEVMERTVSIRSGFFQLPFGDQAIACRKTTYAALGGFDDLAKAPMLEDYLLVQKLRRLGKALGTRCITQLGAPARCHPRRWLARPVWRVNWTNQVIMVQVNYRGLSPKQVFELYYGRRV